MRTESTRRLPLLALRLVQDLHAVGTDNVSVHLDTFHMIREEDDMGEAIRACGERQGYFHGCGSQRGVEEATLRRYVGAMIYREYRPTSVLADRLECYWSLRGSCPSANAGRHRILPDGCMDLIFETVSGGTRAPRAFVVGAMPRAAVVPRVDPFVTWGARFRPGGASAYLDVPAHELTGRTPDLEHFWGPGARELRQVRVTTNFLGRSRPVRSAAELTFLNL